MAAPISVASARRDELRQRLRASIMDVVRRWGESQVNSAERLQISREALNRIINNSVRMPSFGDLVTIAICAGLNVDLLITEDSVSQYTDLPILVEYLYFRGWKLDVSHLTLVAPTGEQLGLTAYELRVLLTFIKLPNQILSREKIAYRSNIASNDSTYRLVDRIINNLTRKFGDFNCNDIIVRKRGEGYIFIPLSCLTS